MESVTLRAAKRTDAAAIAALHVASWRDAYASILEADYLAGGIEDDRVKHWAKMIDSNAIIEVAEDKAGNLLAFVCVLPEVDPARGSRVDNLHVLPSHRGRGIGERLLRHAASVLEGVVSRRDIHLWVFEMNERATSFYTRLGGKFSGVDFSRIPAAGGKTIVCIRWPDLASLSSQR